MAIKEILEDKLRKTDEALGMLKKQFHLAKRDGKDTGGLEYQISKLAVDLDLRKTEYNKKIASQRPRVNPKATDLTEEELFEAKINHRRGVLQP